MSRTTRPINLPTAQGSNLQSEAGQWAMRASKAGTSYIKYVAYARPSAAESDAAWMISENTYDTAGDLVQKKFAVSSSGEVADFNQVYDSSSAISISAISKANPGQVTTSAAHGLVNGDLVEIVSVAGMTEVNSDGYGGTIYTVTKVDSTKFTIGVDTSGYTTYTSGGSVYRRTYLNDLTYA